MFTKGTVHTASRYFEVLPMQFTVWMKHTWKGDVCSEHHGDSGKPPLVETLLLTQVDLYFTLISLNLVGCLSVFHCKPSGSIKLARNEEKNLAFMVFGFFWINNWRYVGDIYDVIF